MPSPKKITTAKSKTKSNSVANVLKAEELFRLLKSTENPSSLSSLLAQNNLPKIFIFESESSYRLGNLIETLSERLKGFFPDLDIEKHAAAELQSDKTISSLIFSLNSTSLFSKAKMILVKEADTIKVAQINKILSSSPPATETLLVLLVKKVPALDSWKKLTAQSALCMLAPYTKQELAKWLYRESQKCGVKGIEIKAIEFLIEEIGPQMETLKHLVEKCSLLTSPDQEISLKTVLLLSDTGIQKDTFDLFNAIAKKDNLGAHLILTSILESGTHPLQLLGFFNKAIKSLIAAKDQSVEKPAEYLSDLHNSWFIKKLSPERFSINRLKNALNIISELDSEMKGRNVGESHSIQGKLVNI